jgi:hypothetical protein
MRFKAVDLFNRQIPGSPNISVANNQFGLVNGSAGSNGAGNTRWPDMQGHIRF